MTNDHRFFEIDPHSAALVTSQILGLVSNVMPSKSLNTCPYEMLGGYKFSGDFVSAVGRAVRQAPGGKRDLTQQEKEALTFAHTVGREALAAQNAKKTAHKYDSVAKTWRRVAGVSAPPEHGPWQVSVQERQSLLNFVQAAAKPGEEIFGMRLSQSTARPFQETLRSWEIQGTFGMRTDRSKAPQTSVPAAANMSLRQGEAAQRSGGSSGVPLPAAAFAQ